MKALLIVLLLAGILIGCSEQPPRPVFLTADKVEGLVPYVKRMTVWYSTEYKLLEPWSIHVYIDSPCGNLEVKSDRFETFDEAVKDIIKKTECFKDCKVKQ